MSQTQRNISRRAALASATAIAIAGKASKALAEEAEAGQKVEQGQAQSTVLASAEVTHFLYIDSK